VDRDLARQRRRWPAAGSEGPGGGAAEEADAGGVPMVADVGDGPLALLQKLRLPWAQARGSTLASYVPNLPVTMCCRKIKGHNHRQQNKRLQ